MLWYDMPCDFARQISKPFSSSKSSICAFETYFLPSIITIVAGLLNMTLMSWSLSGERFSPAPSSQSNLSSSSISITLVIVLLFVLKLDYRQIFVPIFDVCVFLE